ncbi:methyltransferase [Nakamurella sp. YIM 132087]|uniref:Methyltransferase n=1 Tax=Nakamurella alba TaxID=2665158 RepID=A0A7K1FHB3_9ACTN|nr:RsmD family RNA methyltransferase [Nakamurella alba]MTD13517.1 methyltransferase [Nakamurella alba]
MTRIVAGRFGGRVLSTPNGTTTRPTSERVRAALGNALESTGGLAGARVLDLYAGSGALGLELVSRGAASVDLVDSDRAALTAARENVRRLDLADAVRVVPASALAFAGGPHPQPYDIVLADPPYDLAGPDLTAVLAALVAAGGCAPGADVVIERSVRSGDLDWPPPLTARREKRYGDTVLHWGEAPGVGPA